LDWGKLIERKDRELDRLNAIYLRMLHDASVTVIDGRGMIEDPHTVRVGDRRYTAKHILVATGGSPSMPKIPGIEHVITSNEALSLPALPRSITIVGGGYIGVEFACIFTAAGVNVTMLLRGPMVLRGFDEDIRTTLTEELRKKGIEIRTEAAIHSIEKQSSG